jgi:hypothetical protein
VLLSSWFVSLSASAYVFVIPLGVRSCLCVKITLAPCRVGVNLYRSIPVVVTLVCIASFDPLRLYWAVKPGLSFFLIDTRAGLRSTRGSEAKFRRSLPVPGSRFLFGMYCLFGFLLFWYIYTRTGHWYSAEMPVTGKT